MSSNHDHSQLHTPTRPSRPTSPSLQTPTPTLLRTSSSNPNFKVTLNPTSPSFYRSISNPSTKQDLEIQEVLAAGPKNKKSKSTSPFPILSTSNLGMAFSNSSSSSVNNNSKSSLKGEKVEWGQDGRVGVGGKNQKNKAQIQGDYRNVYANHRHQDDDHNGDNELKPNQISVRSRTKSEPSSSSKQQLKSKKSKSILSNLFCGSNPKKYSDKKHDSDDNNNETVKNSGGMMITPSIQVTLPTSTSLSGLTANIKDISSSTSNLSSQLQDDTISNTKLSFSASSNDDEKFYDADEKEEVLDRSESIRSLRDVRSSSDLRKVGHSLDDSGSSRDGLRFASEDIDKVITIKIVVCHLRRSTSSDAFFHFFFFSQTPKMSSIPTYPSHSSNLNFQDIESTPRQRPGISSRTPGSNSSTPVIPQRRISPESQRGRFDNGGGFSSPASNFSSSSSIRSQVQARVLTFNERQASNPNFYGRHSSPIKSQSSPSRREFKTKEGFRSGLNGEKDDENGNDEKMEEHKMTVPLSIERPSSRADDGYSSSSSYDTAEDVLSSSNIVDSKGLETTQDSYTHLQGDNGQQQPTLASPFVQNQSFNSPTLSEYEEKMKSNSSNTTSHSHRASDATSEASNLTSEPIGELINDFPLDQASGSATGATFEIVDENDEDDEQGGGSISRSQSRASGVLYRTVKDKDGSEKLQKLKTKDANEQDSLVNNEEARAVTTVSSSRINPNLLMSPDMMQPLSRSNTSTTFRSSKSCSDLSLHTIAYTHDNGSDVGDVSIDRNSLTSSVGIYNSVGDAKVNRGTFGFQNFIDRTSGVKRNQSNVSNGSNRSRGRREGGLGASFGSLANFVNNDGSMRYSNPNTSHTNGDGNRSTLTLGMIGTNLAILEDDEEEENDEEKETAAGNVDQSLELREGKTDQDQAIENLPENQSTLQTLPQSRTLRNLVDQETGMLERSESEATIRQLSQSSPDQKSQSEADQKFTSSRFSMSARHKNFKKLSIKPIVDKENSFDDPLGETYRQFEQDYGHSKSSPIYKSTSKGDNLTQVLSANVGNVQRQVPRPLALVATPTSARSLSSIGNENSRSQSPLPSGMVGFQTTSSRSVSPSLASPARRISYVTSPSEGNTNKYSRNFSKPTHISSSQSSPMVSEFQRLRASNSPTTPSKQNHSDFEFNHLSSDSEDSNLHFKSSNSSPVKRARRAGMVSPSSTSSASGNAFLQGLSRNGIERSRTPSPSPIAASFSDSDSYSSHGRLELEGQKEIARALAENLKASSVVDRTPEKNITPSRRFERRDTLFTSSSSPDTPIKRFSTHLPYNKSSSPQHDTDLQVENAEMTPFGTSRRSSWLEQSGRYGDLTGLNRNEDGSEGDLGESTFNDDSEDDESYILRKGLVQKLSPSPSSPIRLQPSQARSPSSPLGSSPTSTVESKVRTFNQTTSSHMTSALSTPNLNTLSPGPRPSRFSVLADSFNHSTLASPIGMRNQNRISMASEYSQSTNLNRSSFQSSSSIVSPPSHPPPTSPLPQPPRSNRSSSVSVADQTNTSGLFKDGQALKGMSWNNKMLKDDEIQGLHAHQEEEEGEGKPSFQIDYYEDESDGTSSKASSKRLNNRDSNASSQSSGQASQSQLSPPNPPFHSFKGQDQSPDRSKLSLESHRYYQSSTYQPNSPGAASVASFNFEASIANLDPIRKSMFMFGTGDEYLKMGLKPFEFDGIEGGNEEQEQDKREEDQRESREERWMEGSESGFGQPSISNKHQTSGKGKAREVGRGRDGFF